MIQQIVGDIYRSGVLLPGGWRANVLEVEAKPDDFQWLVTALVRQLGLDPEDAVVGALRMVQDRYSFGYVHGLRMSVIGYAHKYLQLYPETAKQEQGYIVPKGFDPEMMQHYYLPTIGSRIEGGVEDVLQHMRDSVEP